MNVKRIVTMGVLLAAFTTGLFANGQNEAPVTKAQEGTIENPITLRFLTWETNTTLDYYNEVIAGYEKTHPGIKIKIEKVESGKADDATKKMDLLMLAGDDLDIVQCTGNIYASHAKQGLFYPLDSVFPTENGKTYEDIFNVDTKIDGHYYGVPNGVLPSIMFFNKDALDKAGLSIPTADWTWDGFREYNKKLTYGEGNNKVYGSFMPTWSDPVHSYIAMNETKKDNPLFYDENTPCLGDETLKNWLQFRYTLENVDKTQVPYYEVKSMNLSYKDYFMTGKCNILPVFGPWIFGVVSDHTNFPHDFKVAVSPLPAWKDGPKGWTRAGVETLAVSKTAAHPKEAAKFILYMAQNTSGSCTKIRGVKNLNSDDIVRILTHGNTKDFDVESIKNTFKNIFYNITLTIPEQEPEILRLFYEEQEKYLVGGETIEECQANMVNRAQIIMED